MERQIMSNVATAISTPFHTKKGELEFPVQAMRHIAFIWPTPPPKTFGELGILDIPEQFREDHQDGTGLLLSIGPGVWLRDQKTKKMKWFPPPEELVPGCRVYYDKSVPWNVQVQGLDGEMHKVVYCGFLDIHGLVVNQQ
jgi:hypothetical protein